MDSDTKVIISGAVILLVGIIVWKKQSFFIALVFCVLCFVFCVLFIKASMMFLAIVMLLSWGEPENSFYFIFPVISVFTAVFFPDKRWPKHTGHIYRCSSCMNFVNYKFDKCSHCGSDMDSKNI
ncbi:TPA: hypothetical protein O4E86_002643 [Klebsiella oxytoca]|uniref:hypothetical protein n=1 Tax=Klebsiella oxytoca TaxID=571 RepID=UPI000FD83F9D|nr:hypothetical protein [Klebsiella oxytoca]EIX9038833.1 hypothetical protein [Klebsiella oxytoca]ELR9659066.1 hypothetical protein [Klebsiella oxytoca]ELW9515303.1 hypothetical protein [Klebsiella oxytoca]MBZ7484661.1 hypothetical protein [Klebsiella oxytoca]MCW9534925.1 hypothetical protein [Klebsiella oxytoca]